MSSRTSRWPGVGVVALTLITVGCTGGESGSASSSSDRAASTEALPAHAPDRFGFGRDASPARIAEWDIDVRPDGTGLPAGRGSVAEGELVYARYCAACHGPTGTEGPEDRLVDSEQWDLHPTSRTVGNYWPYATTLYSYIRKAMPQTTPGVLTNDEVYAVVAWILHRNEIIPEDAVLDAQTLPAVQMPARDRFVVDDRTGGPGPVR
ncbi:MAG: cytochrome c [Longimicrobiales bacterium]|nr:cytochrome c [Longimicrobiales bacterium]